MDVAGNLRRVIDPSPGGTTRYDYDSFGHLNRIQDAIGAVSTGAYDVRGFRTSWSDADAGAWTFTRNSLGEVVAWTDANGRSFTSAYDSLGRRVSRTEPEGTSTWTWGSSATARNIGRLQSKAGLGYSETFAYDGLGRVSTRTIKTDQSYRYDYTYNSIGEVDTLTYPSSPVPSGQSGSRFRLRYSYSFGAPSQIDDVTLATPRTLWKLDAVSDFDAPTQESMSGNAIARSSRYDSATQRLTVQQAGTAGAGSVRQNLAYQWDAVGNLLQRRDLNQNLTEAFTYDGLDRVTNSTLNGSANLSLSYDASGNVLQKSDIGSYAYGNASRPHAVTAAGSETFTYDRNGNLASRNGLAQGWASFNLPTTLRKPGVQAQIAYGPDRERWRQVASYQNGTETTHYVGSLLEKESTTSTGLTYWRHYVPTPGGSTVVVSRNSNGTVSTTYVMPDHLGSSDTLLNETGATVAKESFGTFGTRRGSNWSAATAPDWLGVANTTRQGFTGHEMLDNVGLVHMNGRVYDPALGRFLSADPLIGDLGDSQSLNPYAYVGNRPLNATDPTGYVVDGGLSLYVGKFVVDSILSSLAYGLLTHGGLPPPPASALPGQSAQNGVGIVRRGDVLADLRRRHLVRRRTGHGTQRRGDVDLGRDRCRRRVRAGKPRTSLRRSRHQCSRHPDPLARPRRQGCVRRCATGRERHGHPLCRFHRLRRRQTVPVDPGACESIAARRKFRSTLKSGRPEIVQRAMSPAELEAMSMTGLLRGGRAGSHYVSDAVNSTAGRHNSLWHCQDHPKLGRVRSK